MKRERIRRLRASAVVVNQGRLLTVKLEDPSTKQTQYFVPGGRVEQGEDPAQAALRETREETGLEISLLAHPPVIARYPYTWNDVTYECETWFYAGICRDEVLRPVVDEPYNRGAEWIALTELERYLGFDRSIFDATVSLIRSVFGR